MSNPTPQAIPNSATPDVVTSSSSAGRGRVQNRRRNTTHIQSNATNFEGSSGTLNCALGMKAEKLHKKLPFHQFSKKVYYHIVSEYKDGGDLYSLFKNLGDLYDDIAKDMPIKPELDDDEDQSVIDTEKEIYKEEIKQFVLKLRTTACTYVHIYELCSHLTTLTRHENKQIHK